jgi:hypothetical protein
MTQIDTTKQIETVIVLRNDQTTAWETSEYVLLKGEIGICYLDNGNVIARLGDGENTWKNLSQLEGVFEEDLILSYDFGKYKIDPKVGFKKINTKDKTISQWLSQALSEAKEPVIILPTFSLEASGTANSYEIGEKIKTLCWESSFTYGSYEYGPELDSKNTICAWKIHNDIDDAISAASVGSFNLEPTKQIQLDTEGNKTYATIIGEYDFKLIDSDEVLPYNSMGNKTEGKIENQTGTITAPIEITAYRKSFWGALKPEELLDINHLTSFKIRQLDNSSSSVKKLPSKFNVPAGSQQVIFAAKSGAYNLVSATDSLSMYANIAFEKKEQAVLVEGANQFEPIAYDIWSVTWSIPLECNCNLILDWEKIKEVDN